MKLKGFVVLFILLSLAVLLLSCGKSENTDGKKVVKLSLVENIAEYTVVRGEGASSDEAKLAGELRSAISSAIGTELPIKIDSSIRTELEILVGNTDRAETKQASEGLRYDDYVIKRIGKKIVVAGGSQAALERACAFFKKNLIIKADGTVKVPSGEGYTFKGDYKVNSFKIDGVDISEFSVYYKGSLLSFEEGALADFINELRSSLGIAAKTQSTMLDSEHYIIIDNTSLVADEYSVEIEDGNIRIKGSYSSISAALDYFVSDYLGSSKNISLKSGDRSEIRSIGKKDIYSKDQLMNVLTEVYNDSEACIIGQQCEGGRAMINDTIEDFMKTSGQKPGIIGLDLACYGVELKKLEAEKVSKLVCEIVDYCAKGGILTVSSHWDNPSDLDMKVRGTLGEFATPEEHDAAFKEVYTEGSELNAIFKSELALNGEFLGALQANSVPLIWRPLHEMNANWFWYCLSAGGAPVSAEVFIDCWKYIHDYYTKELKLDNLIWCYSPNCMGVDPYGVSGTLYLYPGDEYCDMVGCDWYTWGGKELRSHDNYLKLVEESGKIGALTEFGVDGNAKAPTLDEQIDYYNTDSLMSDLNTLKNEGYKFTYLLTWTPGSAAAIGILGGEDGATEFMNEDYTLGLDEVKAMFDKLK